MVHRKIGKREYVYRKVISVINSGEVRPGDRLLPARELAAQYQVNLRTVLAALKELAAEGVLDNVPRKGYFVKKTVTIPLPVSKGHDPVSVPGPTDAVVQDPQRLLTPLRQTQDLSLYISDVAPGQLRVWQAMINEFRSQHPGISLEIFTGNDGHVENILRERPIDVIHSSSKVLSSCQAKNIDFISLRNLKAVGIDHESLLPGIRRYLEHDYRFFGIPFAMEMHMMYMNMDLLESQSSWFKIPDTFENLLPSAERKPLMVKNNISTPNAKFFYLLKAGEGIRFPGETNRIEMDAGKIRQVLDIVERSEVKLALNTTTRETPLFTNGQYPLMFHRLQMVSVMDNTVDFNWQAVAIPDQIPHGKWNDVMHLAINKETEHLHESLELVKHFCSLECQMQFDGLFGRIPILTEAFHDGYLRNSPYIDPTELLKSVAQGEVAPPATAEEAKFEDEINACGESFQAGLMSADEVIARIEFMYDYYFSELIAI